MKPVVIACVFIAFVVVECIVIGFVVISFYVSKHEKGNT